jgi:hypothetical protein
MGQSFQILLSDIVVPTSSGVTSNLSLNDGYYSYDQRGLNQGIVTEFNVLQYLNDPKNIDVSTDFFNYLENNTTNDEFEEIVQSNAKLATVFKQYYTTSILLGKPSPTSIIDTQLSGTSAMTVVKYYDYSLSGTSVVENIMTGTPASIIATPINAINREFEELITYTSEVSYYLPIKLNTTIGESSIVNFSAFSSDDIVEYIDNNGIQQKQFLKQGFVDLNKKSINSVYFDSGATIGFSSNTFVYSASNSVQVVSIYLNEMSKTGQEQISLFYDGNDSISGTTVSFMSGSTMVYLKNINSTNVVNPITITYPVHSEKIDLFIVPNEVFFSGYLTFNLNINSISNGIPGKYINTQFSIFP